MATDSVERLSDGCSGRRRLLPRL